MSYLEKEQELQSMVGQGQMLEAFEKFYGENVVMEEPMSGRTEGKKSELGKRNAMDGEFG